MDRFYGSVMTARDFVALVAASTLVLGSVASAADAPHNVRGTIASSTSTSLTVSTAEGPVALPLGAKTGIFGVVPAKISDITPGTFIGTANVPGPGASRALEVVVFPKALAGTAEGDYPWDLPATGSSHSMMTNGTVAPKRSSMMTNGTVKTSSGADSKTVTLTYKGGTRVVSISDGIPVVLLQPASRAALVNGASVFVVPGKDGGPAPFVVIGEKGVKPPM
jgi:hypothetical protein